MVMRRFRPTETTLCARTSTFNTSGRLGCAHPPPGGLSPQRMTVSTPTAAAGVCSADMDCGSSYPGGSGSSPGSSGASPSTGPPSSRNRSAAANPHLQPQPWVVPFKIPPTSR
jgi:hypothetical protein